MANPTVAHYQHFQSLPAVLRYIDSNPRVWSGDYARKQPKDKSWDLNAGYDGALKLCKTGWPEGGKDMRVIFKALPRAQGAAMLTRHVFTEGEFDIGRYLQGNPQCFAALDDDEDADTQSPIIRLAVSNSTGAMTDARHMHNYGAAIAAAVESLELQGYRVELSVHNVCLLRGKRCVTGWTVKQASDPMDMAALAFSIAHPGALRRITFALKERTPREFEDSGYGAPRDMVASDLPAAPYATIVLNGARTVSQFARTPAEAVEYVEARIREALETAGQ